MPSDRLASLRHERADESASACGLAYCVDCQEDVLPGLYTARVLAVLEAAEAENKRLRSIALKMSRDLGGCPTFDCTGEPHVGTAR